jgi:hypothetical protein
VVADTVPPRFTSSLRLERARFRAAAARKRKSTPAGSGFRFSLSEPAAVTIALTRARPGRRSGRRCVPPSARNRRAGRCTRYVAAGSLSIAASQGPNRLAFSGRVRRRKLAPGSYRATATARDRAGNVSKTSVAGFTIVSR